MRLFATSALLITAGLVACPPPTSGRDGSGAADAAVADALTDVGVEDARADAAGRDGAAEDAGVCLDDDSYEPNNAPAQAAAIATPIELTGLAMCDDVDWFALTAPANQGVGVRIDFDHLGADLDLYLYRASDLTVPLQASADYGDTEQLVEPLLASATDLLIAVRRYGGNGTRYTLRVELFAGGHCDDDRFEINDTAAQAVEIGSGASGLVLCPGNEDHYLFSVSAPGGGSRVVVAHGPTPLNVALTEVGSTSSIGQLRLDATAGITEVTFASASATRYHLVVSLADASEPISYAVSVFGSPPANDDCARAQLIAPGAAVAGTTENARNDYQFNAGGASCAGSAKVGGDVVYAVSVPAGEVLQAQLRSEADLALYALADCATRCCLVGADDSPANSSEALGYRNDGSAPITVYLVVDSFIVAVAGPFALEVWYGAGRRDGGASAIASGRCTPDPERDAGVAER